MDQLNLKLHTEPLPDTTECTKRVNKLQQTRLPVSLLGQEDSYTEQSWTTMFN